MHTHGEHEMNEERFDEIRDLLYSIACGEGWADDEYLEEEEGLTKAEIAYALKRGWLVKTTASAFDDALELGLAPDEVVYRASLRGLGDADRL